MTAAAFAGTYADFKTVKTRSTFQVIVEMPIEQAEKFIAAFGMPIPGAERPVALALLNLPTDKPASSQGAPAERPRQRWGEMSRAQQAGILCADAQFQAWMDCETEMETAANVRGICGVRSRTYIDGDRLAEEAWDRLVASFRQDTGQTAEVRG